MKSGRNLKKSGICNSQYSKHNDFSFYGHGKVLLTGEYFVLDGAKALALPTVFGQSLSVRHFPSQSPHLNWKSLNHKGSPWFKAIFDLSNFKILNNGNDNDRCFLLQSIFKAIRKKKPSFLRGSFDIFISTHLEFPLEWGLGSSSTLIANMAKYASIPSLELFFSLCQGSGYDVVCADAEEPIFYKSGQKEIMPASFHPNFRNHLFFVYLGHKKHTQEAVAHYRSCKRPSSLSIKNISEITNAVAQSRSLKTFQYLIEEHENIVSSNLGIPKVKDSLFPDFPGSIKSLGAWGGDFVLAASNLNAGKTKDYFTDKGLKVFFPYKNFVLQKTIT